MFSCSKFLFVHTKAFDCQSWNAFSFLLKSGNLATKDHQFILSGLSLFRQRFFLFPYPPLMIWPLQLPRILSSSVDYDILFGRLAHRFGITGKALSWLTSYLTEGTQLVKVANKHSTSRKPLCGVPQGSVLGPVLYSTYTTPLAEIIRQYGLNFHFHADDTQLYLSFNSKATGEPMHSLSRVQSCISDITNWMASNKLRLKSDKTEILVLNACHRASSFTVVYYSSP